MNIGFPNATSSTNSPVETQKRTSSAASSPASAGAAQATPEVSLSQTGVQGLKAQLASVPSIRQERVQALQKAVESGSYKPSNQEIASAIHADLFGAPSNTVS